MTKKPNLPVPAGPAVEHEPSSARRVNKAYENVDYAAQVLGGGEKRGLRGGPETLGRAKKTYLTSEYSGPNDRRPAPGRIKHEKI
ncbi:hypothetical protein Astex_0839 [Asticcacaulis excentricus CB 48]|uniref:Uncharacterized protein n=1 Tax=Asticcacaulis excentricus (strain ATCC 15261 / DSM 4724 / KCTC 12464 / NCIMB 9791 / VKM B-1370 / CB 48) TaxID=573065 RepID=E8RKW2_ASTEC|nr:hypothetical protein Astex_0839 [Asticcacaulis excentricus CB 48]